MVANKDKYFYGSSGTQGLKFYEQIGLGAAAGALKIGEGIAELGAGFSDYAFEAKTIFNNISFNLDARLDNNDLKKKELNY